MSQANGFVENKGEGYVGRYVETSVAGWGLSARRMTSISSRSVGPSWLCTSRRGLGLCRARLMVLAGLVLSAVLLLGPSAASAASTHFFKEVFGGVAQPSFAIPEGLAVDQSTGDVLVIDDGVGTISRYNPDGTSADFSALAGNVIDGRGSGDETPQDGLVFSGPSIGQVAVDNSGGATDGDIYVTQGQAVDVFGSDGKYLGQLTGSSEGLFGYACGVGVDASGTVYVGDYNGSVHKFVPSTNPPVDADNVANFFRPEACTLAAGMGPSAGFVFSDNYGGELAKLDATTGEDQYEVSSANTTVTVDPVTGHVLVAAGSAVNEYDVSSPFGAILLSSFSGPGTVLGVAVNGTTGDVYVAREGKAQLEVWGPAVTLPDVSTEAATPVDEDSVVLHGTISATGGPEAKCQFQYTPEAAFKAEGFTGASSVSCPAPNSFTGSSVEGVSVEVSGLTPGTTYFFRLVGSNANGSNPDVASKVGALSFRIGPAVLTSAAGEITATAATVRGVIEPNIGEGVSYQIQYGLSEAYGSSAPLSAVAVLVPQGTGNIEFGSNVITGVAMTQGAFAVGQEIRGEGIPAGTTVTSISTTFNSVLGASLNLTLSKFPTFGGFGVALSSPTAAVVQRLKGLIPGTLYHFRIVAKGAAIVPGPDHSFTTFSGQGGSGSRGYELVSPAAKIGEVMAPGIGGSCSECLPSPNEITMPVQASPDGEAVVFEGQPFSSGLAPSANEYLAGRSESGWAKAQSITPPRASKGTEDKNSGFKGFSADLSRGVLFQASPALSKETPEEAGKAFNDLYLWEAGNPALRPLVTVKPPQRVAGTPSTVNGFELAFAGGNAGGDGVGAFTHVVFEANDALTGAVAGIAPVAPEAGAGSCGGFAASVCDLYEWVGGQLRLVNVLPGNTEAAAGAVIGSGRRLAAPTSGDNPENQAADVDHAVSADGGKIFWSDAAGRLYVRIDGTETVEVKDPGQFLTASSDGSKVLLSDGCLYDLVSESCEATLSHTPVGLLGIMGASEDLSRIYFVSTEALAPGAVAETCETLNAGRAEEEEGKVPVGLGCNLYVYDEGEVSFIARLHQADNEEGLDSRFGDWKVSRSNRTAQVSPDGRYLTFMSYASLTGYDNRPSDGGHCGVAGCGEVYEYDLASHGLVCPSCNPSGQRPQGRANLSLIEPKVVPTPFRQPENLPAKGEGRLFFESQDVLSPKDINGGIQDVYEWTPNGVGGCARAQGCVALVSSGHSPNDSYFVDSTPSGRDVFFITREQLVAGDEDDLLDVYDARIGGGLTTSPPAPCGGEACKGPISGPSEVPAGGSANFSGPGNLAPSSPQSGKPKPLSRAQKLAKALKACAKKPRGKRRRVCQALTRKRYRLPRAVGKSKSNQGGK